MKRKCLGKARIIVGRRTEASTNSVTPLKISNDYRFKNRLPKTEKSQGERMEDQEEQIVRMVKETDVPLTNPYNLSTISSPLGCVYWKSILGPL